MGLFNLKRKRKSRQTRQILGMILLEDTNSMQISKVVAELRDKWKLSVDDSESNQEASLLIIDNYLVTIAHMPMPIPGDEVKSAADYNYFWLNGINEASKHEGHVIASIMDAGKDPLKENILFNKVVASILSTCNSLGVYIGGRTLLLKKDFYLVNCEVMSDQNLPLYSWIYFGLRQENGKQSVYTYGLADFDKPEMEIINSKHSLKELNEIMFNMAHYVLTADVILKDGETIGTTATQKLGISYSKGRFLDDKTIKIKY